MAMMIGADVTVFTVNGNDYLGTWQDVSFDYDVDWIDQTPAGDLSAEGIPGVRHYKLTASKMVDANGALVQAAILARTNVSFTFTTVLGGTATGTGYFSSGSVKFGKDNTIESFTLNVNGDPT